MASSRATIWALVGQIFSLQWCRKNIALPQEAEKYNIVDNPLLARTFKVFSSGAAIRLFSKQRSSNSEPVNHIVQNPKKPHSLLSLAAAENQAQKSDQHQGLDR